MKALTFHFFFQCAYLSRRDYKSKITYVRVLTGELISVNELHLKWAVDGGPVFCLVVSYQQTVVETLWRPRILLSNIPEARSWGWESGGKRHLQCEPVRVSFGPSAWHNQSISCISRTLFSHLLVILRHSALSRLLYSTLIPIILFK